MATAIQSPNWLVQNAIVDLFRHEFELFRHHLRQFGPEKHRLTGQHSPTMGSSALNSAPLWLQSNFLRPIKTI